MTESDIVCHRLRNQLLHSSTYTSPAAVVQWLGCLQATDYTAAKRSIISRMHASGNTSVDTFINQGILQRSFLLKPIHHLVTATDNTWIQTLTTPLIKVSCKRLYHTLSIDPPLLKRSRHTLEKILRDGQTLTRQQLTPHLGLSSKDLRINILLMDAELEGIICSGPLSGKTFTYRLQPPQAVAIPAEEAVAVLAQRYFRSRGPARLQDFVYWSGLPVPIAKKGLSECALSCEVVDGEAYWFSSDMDRAVPVIHGSLILPAADEFYVGYEEEGSGGRVGQFL
ncbi:DNA glycosylase AlkZ-like family protein [Chitinophaga sp. HK235]|uniref:DNA glycosylase AlkZ-like family protein n=1 Tax=Chitinophaga sp. HK235 TaxID=2952571 RepID=UPI001BAAF494|nr:crosslink repair DNA glycosylase YcaQ family protein [Chitinophaga sp. HK235]